MFNVKKSIEKLEEMQRNRIIKCCPVDMRELGEIISAGDSSCDDDVRITTGNWIIVLDRLNKVEERLERLEQSIVKSDNRLSRLEEQFNNNFPDMFEDVKKETYKPTELNKACEEFYKGDGWKPMQSRAEGKTPEYLMGIEGKTPDYLTGGKPEKSVTEENKRYKCLKCGRDKFDKKEPHNCVNGYTKRHLKWEEVKDDKPSEYIRISRKVAEEWMKVFTKDGKCYSSYSINGDMWGAIKKALEG